APAGAPACRRNAALAAVLALNAAAALWLLPAGEAVEPETVLYLTGTALMIGLALARPAPAADDCRWWVYALCAVSFYYPFAYQPVDLAGGSAGPAVLRARIVFHILADVTLLTLGRSFAVLPALRGVRTGALYRLVRHPVYALYMVADACLLLVQPSAWNGAVAFAGASTFVLRAGLEERVLQRDAGYQEYMQRVRWRFIPWVY
ncbi:MAG TPA: hypothetical protein VFE78_27865, partial [Gemmataceae bacterium]|nr:hypothetical protein [Gemmataceae bacterium]